MKNDINLFINVQKDLKKSENLSWEIDYRKEFEENSRNCSIVLVETMQGYFELFDLGVQLIKEVVSELTNNIESKFVYQALFSKLFGQL